jgi:radical SAM superfamily enzyme YgiQ (UPF0313 family)
MTNKQVLLTTIFRPFSIPGKFNTVDGEKFLDYFSNRLTRESGPFVLHDNHPTVPIYILADNIEADTTVLEYPTLEEFKAELRKNYDVLGISFLVLHFPKLVHMIALARKIAPETKIVIGGFGTALYHLERLEVDAISHGEGVEFLRRFLGEYVSRPITHPLLTVDVKLRLGVQHTGFPGHRCGIIVNGFGCPHGCEFCSTSAYFGRKHVPFMSTADDLVALMERYERELGVRDFIIYEEDFFLYKKDIDRFIELSKSKPRRFSYACYSTIKALSQHNLEDLVKTGLSHVWIGVESSSSPFNKSRGRNIHGLFTELQSYGVTTTGSIIAGLDFHKKDNLHLEFEHLASLFPSTVQISNLIAGPGTPLRDRLEREKRLVEDVDLKDSHLYSDAVAHPEFGRGELRELIFQGYEYIYHKIGPSLYRILRTWFRGFEGLSQSDDPHLQLRARVLEDRIQQLRPVFVETQEFLPNDAIRLEVNYLLQHINSRLGGLSVAQQQGAAAVRSIFDVERKRFHQDGPHVYEPSTKITNYSHRAVAESVAV